jgi:hypothetical protein
MGATSFWPTAGAADWTPKRLPGTRHDTKDRSNPETKQKTPFFRDFLTFPGLGRPKTGDPSHQGSIFWDLQGLQRGFV